MTEFKNNFIQKIQDGELGMKPRWHFVLKTALVTLGAILAGLFSVYLLSLVVFVMTANGLIFSVFYGFRGVSLFVLGSPWLLISAAGLFGLTLYLLVTQFAFSYKRPLIYSLFGAVLVVLLGAFLLGQTNTHDRLRQHGTDSNRPFLKSLYGGADERPRGATSGVIRSLHDNGFMIETPEGEMVRVVVSVDTRTRPDQVFIVDEHVLVLGKVLEGEVEAIGVKVMSVGAKTGGPEGVIGPGPRVEGASDHSRSFPSPENRRNSVD